jgi:hypothetical protein
MAALEAFLVRIGGGWFWVYCGLVRPSRQIGSVAGDNQEQGILRRHSGEGCQGDGWLTGDARTWFGFGRKVFETPINLG